MELLQTPEIKLLYDKCKYKVKLWENQFRKDNGRLPSKLDIREASRDIRDAYRTYFRLKTAALEESLLHIDEFSTGGEPTESDACDNSRSPDCKPLDDSCAKLNDNAWGAHLNNKITKPNNKPSEKPKKPSVNLNITNKLFEAAKSSKRLPRKSLSFTRKKSESEATRPQFLSQPNLNDSEKLQNVEPISLTQTVKTATPTIAVSSQPLNIVQNVVNNNFNYKPRTIDAGWIERVTQTMNEQISHSNNIDYESDDIIANSDEEDGETSVLFQPSKKQKVFNSTSDNHVNQKTQNVKLDSSVVFQQQINLETKTCYGSACNDNNPVKSGAEQSNHCEVLDSVDKENVYEFKEVPKIIPRVKTKIKSATLAVAVGDNSQTRKAEEKLKQKMKAGTMNDNFVQINLKKKVYARHKSKKTFSSYKKQQWKNKKAALYGPDMDMRGCDGGAATCFKCGKTGHFARGCTAVKGDLLLPLVEEEPCSYPTLEEAARMAQESVLAVRKPSKALVKKNGEVFECAENETKQGFCELFNSDDEAEMVAETNRLEEEVRDDDVQVAFGSVSCVRPYYSLKEDGSLIETPPEVFAALRKFGHDSFRCGQEQAVMRILSGRSTLVTLSTGYGKSLCYQLPAYLYYQRERCISLVVSPLVSLMEDQVTGIPAFLTAACLHTNQTKAQRDKVMEIIDKGNLNILLISPEAVVAGEKSSGFGSVLRKLPPIAFACIDEAHCMSQWSHNFRPAYLKVCRVLREQLSVQTILGLTATATKVTSDSIIRHLNIPDGKDGVISNVPLPDNLQLTISHDAQKDQALLGLLLSEKFLQYRSIIVYCTRREECQRVATLLRTSLQGDHGKKRKRFSSQAECYHAGLSASKRKSIQKAFMSGELRIVVATVAFGMGINKSDIRAVIHYNMPMSFENYVQEVGRAGRDSLPAHCHLFLDSEHMDEYELRRHVYANSTDRHVIRKLLQRCFIPCSCADACPRHEVAFSIDDTVQELDMPEENIETLLCYLELHSKQYVKLLSHVYVSCRIVSYDGPNLIKKAANDCPPLAMAMALCKDLDEKSNVFEFPVVEVAAAMGWDSGICKHKLKNLEWITENNQPKRSKLTVQFSNLGFHLLSRGNLTDSELDEALDNLYGRVQDEERTSLLRLRNLHESLTAVAAPTYHMCLTEAAAANIRLLKLKIREYFECLKSLEPLSAEVEVQQLENKDQIARDVRSLVCMYRDNMFSGRTVAKIFQGIQSPNYPAFMWGRCKFWRAHLQTDFNAICQIATKEILNMR